jgi:hypothetical protein
VTGHLELEVNFLTSVSPLPTICSQDRLQSQPVVLRFGITMHGSSLLHDLLWAIFVPPCGALAWLIASRGWTSSLGNTDDPAVSGWTQSGFRVVLILLYAIVLAMLIYKYFIMPSNAP